METTPHASSNMPLARFWAGVAVVTAIGAILCLAIAGWLTHGSTILFTLAQEGLAWCL